MFQKLIAVVFEGVTIPTEEVYLSLDPLLCYCKAGKGR